MACLVVALVALAVLTATDRPLAGGFVAAIAGLLVALWLIGMVTTTTLGGWLHILLVVAVIFLLIRLIRGQPV